MKVQAVELKDLLDHSLSKASKGKVANQNISYSRVILTMPELVGRAVNFRQ